MTRAAALLLTIAYCAAWWGVVILAIAVARGAFA